jgi:hypothetical protein
MAKRKQSPHYSVAIGRIQRMGVEECEEYARSNPAFGNDLVRRLRDERRELLDNGTPKDEANRLTQDAWIKGVREHREYLAMDFFFRRMSPQWLGALTRRQNVDARSMAA